MKRDVKEYLRELSDRNRKLDSMILQLKALKELVKGKTNSRFDDLPNESSAGSAAFENLVCRISALEEDIQKEEMETKAKKAAMLGFISQIADPDEQSVLIERYFNHKSWKEISFMLFCSISWIYKLHGRALESLREITWKEDF